MISPIAGRRLFVEAYRTIGTCHVETKKTKMARSAIRYWRSGETQKRNACGVCSTVHRPHSTRTVVDVVLESAEFESYPAIPKLRPLLGLRTPHL